MRKQVEAAEKSSFSLPQRKKFVSFNTFKTTLSLNKLNTNKKTIILHDKIIMTCEQDKYSILLYKNGTFFYSGNQTNNCVTRIKGL